MDLKHLPRKAAGASTFSPYESKIEIGAHNQRLSHVLAQDTAGCQGISAGLIVMPPKKMAKAHIHKNNEIVLFVLEGWGAALVGPNLEPIFHGPGDFFYFPAGVEHLGINLSDTQRLVLIEIRTDPKFNEDLVLLPELQAKAQDIAKDLWQKFKAGEIMPETRTQNPIFVYDESKEEHPEPQLADIARNNIDGDDDAAFDGAAEAQPLQA